MAFQVGTQVSPELGRADLSGFERSGQYIGQALANLGQEIGAGIKAKQAKKEKRDTQKRRSEYIYGLSQSETGLGSALRKLGVTDEDSAGSVVETLGDSFVPVLSAVQEQIAMAEDQKTLQTALAVNTDTEGKVDWDNITSSYIELGGSDPAGVAKLTEQYGGLGDEFRGHVYTVDGVTFAQTSRGGTQVIDSGKGEEPKTTAQMQNFKFTQDQIEEARKLYQAGKVDQANDIFLSLGIERDGLSVSVEEYFAPITVNDDSKGTTTDGLTPEERAEYEELKRLQNQ
jgi:hypothetical protein